MAFDLTALTDYTDENRELLIGETVAGAKSVKILDLQTGFKSSGAINLLNTDVVFQDGSVCGNDASGTTTLDQRILTVGTIEVKEDLCVKTLEQKWSQHLVKAGSRADALPFAEKYNKLKIAKINHANEVAIWQGDTTSSTVNLKRFDGLIKIIDAASASTIEGNTSSATEITKANIVTLLQNIYAVVPTALIESGDNGDQTVDNLAILVGSDTFRYLIFALMEANLYHYNPQEAANNEIMLPGTNAKVIAVGGLTGTNRMFAGMIGEDGNFVIGTDLENEEEKYEMWYSKDDDVVKFKTIYKLGTQIKEPSNIVQFTLSA